VNKPLTSTYDVLRQHGVDRRDFIRFCVTTAAAMGLEASAVPRVVSAMENKPRIPVLWLHGLECTCCSESFIRSSHPITQDVVLNMISLDYDDTLQAAAGLQAEEIRQNMVKIIRADTCSQWKAMLRRKTAECIAPSAVRHSRTFSGRRQLTRKPS
jgi:NiFe hydrogenase small subunit HydA